jgi:hypothetical protein
LIVAMALTWSIDRARLGNRIRTLEAAQRMREESRRIHFLLDRLDSDLGRPVIEMPDWSVTPLQSGTLPNASAPAPNPPKP